MGSTTKTWIEVDFTSQERGLVWARSIRATGRTVAPGRRVLAFDPDGDLCADALVERIEGDFVYLKVDWDSQRDWSSEPAAASSPGIRARWDQMLARVDDYRNEGWSGAATVPGRVRVHHA